MKNTYLFSAALTSGAVEGVLMSKQGSETHLLPISGFKLIEEALAALKFAGLEPPHSFSSFDKVSTILRHKKVILDAQFSVHHTTKLILPNIEWHEG